MPYIFLRAIVLIFLAVVFITDAVITVLTINKLAKRMKMKINNKRLEGFIPDKPFIKFKFNHCHYRDIPIK